MRVWPALVLALSIFAVPANSALGSEPKITPFLEAEAAFKANFPVDRRVTVQLLLTAIGYWNAVATENFSPRLFKAIQRFQSENGFPPTGVLERPQIERLASFAGAVYKIWGFRKVDHPSRKVSLWIPFGLGLLCLRSSEGITFFESSERINVDFKSYPNISAPAYYEFILNKLRVCPGSFLWIT